MRAPADAIIEELKTAFPSTRDGPFVPMVSSVQGHEPSLVEADFADKDNWTTLSPEWLDSTPDGLGSALSFLSGAAIRFYIPAYLAADLMGALYHVDPAFKLVHGLDDMSRGEKIWPKKAETWTDLARERWDGLTQSQAAAIAHYLEWRVERDGADFSHTVVEALSAYWYARAAGVRPDLTA